MLKTIATVAILISALIVQAQQTEEYKQWDEGKITVDDFQMEIQIPESIPVNVHYTIEIEPIAGFKIYRKNYNDLVRNVILKKASWIDTTYPEIQHLLRYNQLNFDIMEVYARNIRKTLIENRRELLKGNTVTNIKLELLRNEYAKIKARMESETEGGQSIEAMVKWEEWVVKNLTKLDHFRYDYKGKIIIDEDQIGVQ